MVDEAERADGVLRRRLAAIDVEAGRLTPVSRRVVADEMASALAERDLKLEKLQIEADARLNLLEQTTRQMNETEHEANIRLLLVEELTSQLELGQFLLEEARHTIASLEIQRGTLERAAQERLGLLHSNDATYRNFLRGVGWRLHELCTLVDGQIEP
jgi:hypothetical protein